MTEFLKGYAAGANDMEAGRLVTDTETIESLREQLESWENAAAENAAAHLAAEAKLAEAELTIEDWKRKCDNVHEGRDRLRVKLAEAEKERDETADTALTLSSKLADARASMGRARELAEGLPEDEGITALGAETAREIARILSGDEEPTTKGDT